MWTWLRAYKEGHERFLEARGRRDQRMLEASHRDPLCYADHALAAGCGEQLRHRRGAEIRVAQLRSRATMALRGMALYEVVDHFFDGA
jgi:hypothetical protein